MTSTSRGVMSWKSRLRLGAWFRGWFAPEGRTKGTRQAAAWAYRRPLIEPLETRVLLDAALPAGWQATPIADPHFLSGFDYSGSSTPYGLAPNQIRGAYGLGSYTSGTLSNGITFCGLPADGRGQTIAIVDAYDDPNAASDLNTFSSYFGLPGFGSTGPTFQKLNQTGGTSLPGTDPNGPYATTGGSDWEQEESLDIEWAHAVAPLANIILFEANDASDNLFTAVQTAAKTSGVVAVSMSWSGSEFAGESSYDSTYFTTPSGHIGGSATLGGAGLAGGVTFLASAGDYGAYEYETPVITPQYPATSPNVVAVGGTTLTVGGNSSNYTYGSETAWGNGTSSWLSGGGGGGISAYESQPAYQNGVVNAFSTSYRTYPDVSCDANPNTGVPIYDSWDFGSSTPWLYGYEGGTSLACPLWAGIVAVADEGRAIAGSGSLDGPSQTLPKLYKLSAADFHDITSGSNGPAPTYSAGTGYDLATGIGSPVGNTLIPDLVSTTTSTNLTAGTLSPPRGSGSPTVSTFVGSGLDGPGGMAFDAAGNLYVANAGNNTISEVKPTGAVSTFVSSGLDEPVGLAFDAAGNLYVANEINSTISEVAPTGAVSTFVNSGLDGPVGLAIDAAGNLYVANAGNLTISKVTPTGAVSLFVGSGLCEPTGLAFDSAGNLYVTNVNDTISKVTPTGAVSTFVSSGLDEPAGLAFDSAGNLYVASFGNNSISKVTPVGAVSPFVSSGQDEPFGLAFDAAGTLYVGNALSGTISKITRPVIEDQPFSGTVFHFTDAYPAATASDYTAVVTLGDGNSVTLNGSGVVSGPAGAGGQIVADGTGFDVKLSYTYAEPLSNQTFGVQVTDIRGASTHASTSAFNVAPATLTAGALSPPHGSGSPTVSTFVGSELIGPAEGMAVDAAGNLYTTSGTSTIFKVTPAGAVSTFVSSGLDDPVGLAFDAAGNLYVANELNNTISEVSPTGAVSTFVSGFGNPVSLAFDSAGNLYVANGANNTISKVTPTGSISTFVSGLTNLRDLAIDAAGNLYVDGEYNTILKVTPGGAISTFASSSLMAGATDLAIDSAGNVYVGNFDGNTIYKVTPGGGVSTFVSGGLISDPENVVFDAAGTLYVGNVGNGTISKITQPVIEDQPFSGTVFHFTDAYPAATASDYTAAVTLGDGNSMTLNSSGVVSGPWGASGQIVADGTGFDVKLSYTYGEMLTNQTFGVQVTDVRGASINASTSAFNVPLATLTPGTLSSPNGSGAPTVSTFVGSGLTGPAVGMAFDAAGNLYVANAVTNTIFRVAPTGAVSTFVGGGLDGPIGLAFDAAGNLYVANAGNNSISKVAPTGTVSTFVGSGLNEPVSLAFDAAGNLYVANAGSSTISKVTPTGAVSTFVGSGFGSPNGAGGLALDAAGNLYFDNGYSNTIYRVTPAGAVSTFVSSGLNGDVADLAFDSAGNLYVGNFDGNTISEVTPGGALSIFVGGGLISDPVSLDFDATGNLYVSNIGGDTISKITRSPIEGQPFSGTVFHFTDADPAATASDYTAVVALGDGNSVTLNSSGMVSGPAGAGGQIVADGTGFDVKLSYTYGEMLTNQTFGVQVTDVRGASANASTSPFNVADAALTISSVTHPAAVEGIDTGVVTVAGFSDAAGSYSNIADLGALITWADGQTSAGTVVATSSPGSYIVTGSHTYAQAISTPSAFTVAVSDSGGSSASKTITTATVAEATSLTLSAASGQGTYGGADTLTATLLADGIPLPNETVSFSLDGVTVGTATTNSSGVSTLPGVSLAGLNANTYSGYLAASFAAATNYGGSGTSEDLTVTPEPLTITAAPNNKTYDGTTSAAATPTITSGSLIAGDTAAFTETFDTQNAGSSKMLSVAGSVNDGNGGSNYAVSTVDDLTGVINQAVLTITADNQSRAYGAANPSLSYTLAGFVNGDTAGVVSGVPSLSTTATNPGVYPIGITANTLAANNYSFNFVAGVLTITKANPTIQWANPAAIVYGTRLGTLQLGATVTVSGPAVAGAVSYSSAAGTVLHAGSGQVLTVMVAGTTDYNAASAQVTLNVLPAPLTITANNQSKVYGTALPTLTASYSGWVNGDTSASLTTLPLVSTTATTPSHVGSYPIQAAGAVDPNYTISYVGGNLTVTAAPVVVCVTPLVTNSHSTLTLTGTAVGPSPNAGIATVSVVVNGQRTPATVSGDTWSVSLSTPPAGTYNVQTTATDNAGNSGSVTATGALVVNAGTTLSLSGTSFSFTGGLTPAKWTVLVGGSKVTNIPATTTAIIFTGTGASATAAITGASASGESAAISLGKATFNGVGSGGPYTVTATNLFSATLTSGGSGSLSITDATGGNNLTESPTGTALASSSNSAQAMVANGFNNVIATATGAGSSTIANLFGSNAADTFTANPQIAVMQPTAGTSYRLEADGFKTVRGTAVAGGDTALLTDAAGGTLNATGVSATLSGTGYSIIVNNFASVQATAVGPSDTASLQASPGSSVFAGSKGKSEFKAVNCDNVANGFFTVYAYGATVGSNTAVLTDSAGNATVTLNPQTATLTDASANGPATYQIKLMSAFQVIDAFETSMVGNATAIFKGSSTTANSFTSTATDATLVPSVGSAFREYAKGFATVQATSTYATDTASLYDSPGRNTLTATPTSATMNLASGKTVIAAGFKTVNVYSDSGGTDTANLTGSSGTDTVSLWSTNALMRMSTGNTVRAWYFANYNLNGGGGNDTVTTMDATVLWSKQTAVSGAKVIAWLADFAEINEDYSSGSQNNKSYPIAVDQVLTTYWS